MVDQQPTQPETPRAPASPGPVFVWADADACVASVNADAVVHDGFAALAELCAHRRASESHSMRIACDAALPSVDRAAPTLIVLADPAPDDLQGLLRAAEIFAPEAEVCRFNEGRPDAGLERWDGRRWALLEGDACHLTLMRRLHGVAAAVRGEASS